MKHKGLTFQDPWMDHSPDQLPRPDLLVHIIQQTQGMSPKLCMRAGLNLSFWLASETSNKNDFSIQQMTNSNTKTLGKN